MNLHRTPDVIWYAVRAGTALERSQNLLRSARKAQSKSLMRYHCVREAKYYRREYRRYLQSASNWLNFLNAQVKELQSCSRV